MATQHWQAPSWGFVKVNWDTTIDTHSWKMSIRVIIRDPMGEVLATLQSSKQNILDPIVAESFVALRAISFAKERVWQKVVLEGDTLQVVMALKKYGKNRCRFGQIIDDVCLVLNSL